VHGAAAEPVELVPERVREVRVRAGQVVVQRLLEPGARPALRRVADHLRGEALLRVAPLEERLPGDALARVHGELRAVGADDLSTRDRELRDLLDRVVLAVVQRADRPRLPVRRGDDERDEQHHRHDREMQQLLVHVAGRLARWDTSISPATSRKFETTLEPP
jgi:hypothetical protein